MHCSKQREEEVEKKERDVVSRTDRSEEQGREKEKRKKTAMRRNVSRCALEEEWNRK